MHTPQHTYAQPWRPARATCRCWRRIRTRRRRTRTLPSGQRCVVGLNETVCVSTRGARGVDHRSINESRRRLLLLLLIVLPSISHPHTHTYTHTPIIQSSSTSLGRPPSTTPMDQEEDEFDETPAAGAGRRRQTLVLGATGGGSLKTGGAGGGGVGGGLVGGELVGAFTEAQLNSASDRFREAWARVQVSGWVGIGVVGRGMDRLCW